MSQHGNRGSRRNWRNWSGWNPDVLNDPFSGDVDWTNTGSDPKKSPAVKRTEAQVIATRSSEDLARKLPTKIWGKRLHEEVREHLEQVRADLPISQDTRAGDLDLVGLDELKVRSLTDEDIGVLEEFLGPNKIRLLVTGELASHKERVGERVVLLGVFLLWRRLESERRGESNPDAIVHHSVLAKYATFVYIAGASPPPMLSKNIDRQLQHLAELSRAPHSSRLSYEREEQTVNPTTSSKPVSKKLRDSEAKSPDRSRRVGQPWTDVEDRLVITLYGLGCGNTPIARFLQRSTGAISSRLDHVGISYEPIKRRLQKLSEKERKAGWNRFFADLQAYGDPEAAAGGAGFSSKPPRPSSAVGSAGHGDKSTRFCGECGQRIVSHAKFCPDCGTKQGQFLLETDR